MASAPLGISRNRFRRCKVLVCGKENGCYSVRNENPMSLAFFILSFPLLYAPRTDLATKVAGVPSRSHANSCMDPMTPMISETRSSVHTGIASLSQVPDSARRTPQTDLRDLEKTRLRVHPLFSNPTVHGRRHSKAPITVAPLKQLWCSGIHDDGSCDLSSRTTIPSQ